MNNTRNMVILLFVLGLLAAFYFLFVAGESGSSFAETETAFSVSDTGAVEKIVVRRISKEKETEKLELEKQPDGTWRLNGKYLAFRPKVSNLLNVLNKLIVKEPLNDKGVETALLRMKKYHLDVEVISSAGENRAYRIGPTNAEQTGNYMLLKGSEKPYVMTRAGVQVGYVSIFFEPVEESWRDNEFFSAAAADLSSVEVISKEGGGGFILTRNGDRFELSGAGESDTQKVAQYIALYQGSINAESFAGKDHPRALDSLGRMTPDWKMILKLKDGREFTLILFDRPGNNENYFAWRTDRGELLTVQKYLIDAFLMRRNALLKNTP